MPLMNVIYVCFDCSRRVRTLPLLLLPRLVIYCANCGDELDPDEVNAQ